MKLCEIKKKIEELGYTDDTEIRLFISTYDGDSFELEIENIEDEDRRYGYGNVIDIQLSDPPRDYRKIFIEEYNEKFKNELLEVIDKYM